MDPNERLTRDFFKKDTINVAKELIGKYLVRRTKKGVLTGKIIEVEAYLGPNDKACHTYNYKKTERTMPMYEEPGTLYVYLIYGVYHCLNVITEPKGMPCAVLIRQLLIIIKCYYPKWDRYYLICTHIFSFGTACFLSAHALNVGREKLCGGGLRCWWVLPATCMAVAIYNL